jgi:hypothetical protein
LHAGTAGQAVSQNSATDPSELFEVGEHGLGYNGSH